MTKKDFELIARVLFESDLVEDELDALARRFADALAQTNPLFNRARFIAAATGED